VPTLFISGSLDARTPPSNADEVMKGFSSARHLVIERGAHDDDLFLPSPRIGEAILAHLLGHPVAIERITLPPLRFRTP
jgi:pimeloyl-ACP methyl ester carboxylesterase